jgi:hypothetical protein
LQAYIGTEKQSNRFFVYCVKYKKVSGSQTAAIVGGVIGISLLLVVVVSLAVILVAKKRRKDKSGKSPVTAARVSTELSVRRASHDSENTTEVAVDTEYYRGTAFGGRQLGGNKRVSYTRPNGAFSEETSAQSSR